MFIQAQKTDCIKHSIKTPSERIPWSKWLYRCHLRPSRVCNFVRPFSWSGPMPHCGCHPLTSTFYHLDAAVTDAHTKKPKNQGQIVWLSSKMRITSGVRESYKLYSYSCKQNRAVSIDPEACRRPSKNLSLAVYRNIWGHIWQHPDRLKFPFPHLFVPLLTSKFSRPSWS